MNNLNHLNLNIKNDYSNKLNSKKRNEIKEKKAKTFNKQIDEKNQLISTKNSTQNLFYTQKIKTLMNNYCESKENSKLKNCISAKNIHKKNNIRKKNISNAIFEISKPNIQKESYQLIKNHNQENFKKQNQVYP